MKLSFIFLLSFPFCLNAQLLNGNFEEWPDTSVLGPYHDYVVNEGVTNPSMLLPNHWQEIFDGIGINRVEDSHSGDYGLLLYTWYHYVAGSIQQTLEVEERPSTLTGYYKYDLIGASNEFSDRFAKVAALSSQGDTLGQGYLRFDTSAQYTYFEVPIEYTSDETPEKVWVYFYSQGRSDSNIILEPVNSFLYLDDLNLELNPVSATNENVTNWGVEVYPNPVRETFHLKQKEGLVFDHYQILDLSGKTLAKGELTKSETQIQINYLARGQYFLQLTNNAGQSSTQKLIKN